VHGPVPVGLLFKSAPTRGGFVEDLSISDLHLVDVPVALRATMNWNPAYSQARIPEAERATAPPHWATLAQPVAPELGRTRVEGVRIQRLTARGARVAFEVDATAEVPLRRFDFRSIAIEAHSGGHVQDAFGWHFDDDCQLQLGTPITAGTGCQLAGLPAAHCRIDAELQRRDVSALPMAEQDVL